MALSPLLQIRRMLATRSANDVSVGYLVVLNLGFALWLAYGISIENIALIVPNAIAEIMGTVTLGVALALRRRPHESA
jgi:MtN3 and saliva related transmembrane protein